MKDVLEGLELEKKVLDHGFVRLVDVMPRITEDGTGDGSIVQAARVSYGKGTKTVNQDRGLIRYLMRHRHTTPMEMATIKFHAKMPIFVARQWIRHRTVSVNEYSGRYSEMSDQFYLPDIDRIQTQSKTNKQGSDDSGELSQSTQMMMQDKFKKGYDDALKNYKLFIGDDVKMARELARINLPVSNYTEWYWQINLHNLFHFLKLRMDSHAQYEIRVYADAMYDLIKPIFPLACEAFEDYILNGVTLSGNEVELLKKIIESENIDSKIIEGYVEEIDILSKREKKEFIDKFKV